ncbi:unnamed protein product [Timema podura]|uniref:Uncharacterized protein n=1 Tax=Timema podura TaxID=61482 RepID=A0ABN7PKE1_TIMPD|nr:unnamed protein product [Timema podura]
MVLNDHTGLCERKHMRL